MTPKIQVLMHQITLSDDFLSAIKRNSLSICKLEPIISCIPKEREGCMKIQSYLRFVKHKLFPPEEFEVYDQSIIPNIHLRLNGTAFQDKIFYVHSAEGEAQRVINQFGCNNDSRILDIGCGRGRFAIGLLRLLGPVRYIGLDVHLPSIQWCQKHIESRNPSYRFIHLNIASERYHKNGGPIDDNFRFNIEDESIDIIYLWGVFTNMDPYVMKLYLNDMKRILSPDGNIFFTAFVEENVPDVSVNPKGYIFEEYNSPLLVVRYEKNHIFSLISAAGLKIQQFEHGTEFYRQSALYLSKS